MQQQVDLTLILDKSGSMSSIKAATLDGVNGFIHKQKHEAQEGRSTTFSLVLFDESHYNRIECTNIHEVQKLTAGVYCPEKCTALLDAIGSTIDSTGDRLSALQDKPDKVIIAVMTDGLENSSTDYSRSDVFDKIKHQRDKYDWEFMFLGANQDVINEAPKYGLGPQHGHTYTGSWTATSSGVRQAFKNLDSWVNSYCTT